MSHPFSLGYSWCRALLLALSACESGTHVEVDEHGNIVERCFIDTLYRVEGDTFTLLSSGIQTLDNPHTGFSANVAPRTGALEGRATKELRIKGYRGTAELWWNDALVETFEIDRAFVTSGTVAILDYRDPDGTLVELHLHASTHCDFGWPPVHVLSREQVEAAEGD